MKDLINSPLERANILNNKPALKELYEQVGFRGVLYDGKYRYTKPQVAEWFEVDERTVERILEQTSSELAESGYRLFTGNELQLLKKAFASDIHVVRKIEGGLDLERLGFSPMTRNLGIFTFKAVLNLGMLLTNSNPARELRAFMLDVVIDLLNQRLGGSTKYVNQRDEAFLPSAIREKHYRQAFTDAIDQYIEKSKFKYARLTDAVYVSIFKENAAEYRQILNLHFSESVRDTMYAEVLDLVSSYENGFAGFLKKLSEEMERELSLEEALITFRQFESMTDDLYYPDFASKLTHLVFQVNKGHCFNDGNKRTSIALGSFFLEINGLGDLVDRFIIQMENIAVAVADNLISKVLLSEIILSLLTEEDYNEPLKLKIIDTFNPVGTDAAMSADDTLDVSKL